MMKSYEKVSYEFLRPQQVKEIRAQCPIAYITAGAMEWHGLHNPLGVDGFKAHAVCTEAALLHGGVVLPPFYQGLLGFVNWGPKDWEGYTLSFNEEEMFEAAMTGIAKALVYSGWKVIVGVTGHNVEQQRDIMQRAIESATDGQTSTGFAIFEGAYHTPSTEIPFQMDHAGAWETSCMMYTNPDLVDLDALRGSADLESDDLDMMGSDGIGGKNPFKYASAELGKKIVMSTADSIGRKALEALKRIENGA
ncbi:creatininase family protein [Cohnella silvisoli]|uniref:Creatininase family protein n=1 Tax=Cohnella silvisoli TaxID=2873699 RepID=A0ABV1KXE0_9BACL|nr:creatininase family protein [Cohnella silvisoli]MCD9024100.1 creatininase family protein [Cohnella silvisoli]